MRIGALAARRIDVDDGDLANPREVREMPTRISRLEGELAPTDQLDRATTHQINRRNDH
jgi:hypothetical protein